MICLNNAKLNTFRWQIFNNLNEVLYLYEINLQESISVQD